MLMRRMAVGRSRGLSAVPSRSFAEGPALKLHGIGGRYATALYTVATKKQCFIVGSELESLTALRASTPAFERLISDPTIQDSVKLPALNAIMDKGGFSAPLKKFFGVLVENKRLGDLDKIAADYAKLLAAERDELVAKVTTAVAMTAKQAKALEKALTAHKDIGNGKTVTVTPIVDPKIRGGMIVELDDKVIDTSTAKKLTELQMLLEG